MGRLISVKHAVKNWRYIMGYSPNTPESEGEFEMISFEDARAISEFLVSVGSHVWDDQPLFIFEDGVHFLSSNYGTVTDIFVQPGKIVPVGQNILRIAITPPKFRV